MSEMNQEAEFEVPNQEGDDQQLQESIKLSMLRLDSFKNNQQNRHECTACACNVSPSNPMKLPVPEATPEPNSKTPPVDSHNSLSGFLKLPLPQLSRSVSDPYTPPRPNVSETAKTLEDTPLSKASLSGPAMTRKPPVFGRSLSDPFSFPVKPLSHSASSKSMGSESIREDTPSAKRLKRMRELMIEMNQWVDEGIREDEDMCNTDAVKDNEPDCEEAVRVEKIGECLDLHFKCPCGKGYQILLSGHNCYYKLI